MLGDYEVTDIEQNDEAHAAEPTAELVTITIGSTGFNVTKDVGEQLRDALHKVLDVKD